MTNESSEIQGLEHRRNTPTRTEPWAEVELMTIGNHRKVWYVTDKGGAILYVYLAGGDVLTYQRVLELQRQGVPVRFPARTRVNPRTWGQEAHDALWAELSARPAGVA